MNKNSQFLFDVPTGLLDITDAKEGAVGGFESGVVVQGGLSNAVLVSETFPPVSE